MKKKKKMLQYEHGRKERKKEGRKERRREQKKKEKCRCGTIIENK